MVDVRIHVTATMSDDHALYALCLDRAARFPANTFSEYASRVESLVEIFENVSCQRMTPDDERVTG